MILSLNSVFYWIPYFNIWQKNLIHDAEFCNHRRLTPHPRPSTGCRDKIDSPQNHEHRATTLNHSLLRMIVIMKTLHNSASTRGKIIVLYQY